MVLTFFGCLNIPGSKKPWN